MTKSSEKDCWVGFDLGGTKMVASVFDAGFRKIGRRKNRVGREAADAGLERIHKTIRQALDEAEATRRRLAGIGVGCPGPLELDRGVILEAPNLGWTNVPVKESLEKKFGCPVAIINDVDAGVYGEYRFGAAQSARCVLGVFPGTGIGGGCVYEGRILRGKNTSCMEIGHIQVVPNGPLCGCGRHGCLESVASRLAIAAAAAQAVYRGNAPHLKELAGTDLVNIRSGALAASIRAGDVEIKRIVENAAFQIGSALAGAINLLGPDVVVLGGGLVEAMPEHIVETVRDAAMKRVMPSFIGSFDVLPAKLGDDAAVMGAAAWISEMCLDKA